MTGNGAAQSPAAVADRAAIVTGNSFGEQVLGKWQIVMCSLYHAAQRGGMDELLCLVDLLHAGSPKLEVENDDPGRAERSRDTRRFDLRPADAQAPECLRTCRSVERLSGSDPNHFPSIAGTVDPQRSELKSGLCPRRQVG